MSAKVPKRTSTPSRSAAQIGTMFYPERRGWMVRRRQFMRLLGGAAATLPFIAHAQQPERIKHLGVLIALPEDDPETKARLAEFARALKELSWIDGDNI